MSIVYLVADWPVSNNTSFSDHRYVGFELKHGFEPPSPGIGIRDRDMVYLQIGYRVDPVQWTMIEAYERACPLSVATGAKRNVW